MNLTNASFDLQPNTYVKSVKMKLGDFHDHCSRYEDTFWYKSIAEFIDILEDEARMRFMEELGNDENAVEKRLQTWRANVNVTIQIYPSGVPGWLLTTIHFDATDKACGKWMTKIGGSSAPSTVLLPISEVNGLNGQRYQSIRMESMRNG